MPFSGGGFGNPPYGTGQMNIPITNVYQYKFDAKVFTVALLYAGYRPFKIDREDNGESEVVWAKPEASVEWRKEEYRTKYGQRDGYNKDVLEITREVPDLSYYAKGKVTPIPVQKGMGVSEEAIVLIHPDDGGYINILGVQEPLEGEQAEERVPETA